MLQQSIVMIWSGAIYSNGPALLMSPQKHTEPINDGEKPAGSWAPAAPAAPQLPSSVPDVEISTEPWHTGIATSSPP